METSEPVIETTGRGSGIAGQRGSRRVCCVCGGLWAVPDATHARGSYIHRLRTGWSGTGRSSDERMNGRVLSAIFGGGITIAIGINYLCHHRCRCVEVDDSFLGVVCLSICLWFFRPSPSALLCSSSRPLLLPSRSGSASVRPVGVARHLFLHSSRISLLPSALHSPFLLLVYPSFFLSGSRSFLMCFFFVSFIGFLWLFRCLLSFGFYV